MAASLEQRQARIKVGQATADAVSDVAKPLIRQSPRAVQQLYRPLLLFDLPRRAALVNLFLFSIVLLSLVLLLHPALSNSIANSSSASNGLPNSVILPKSQNLQSAHHEVLSSSTNVRRMGSGSTHFSQGAFPGQLPDSSNSTEGRVYSSSTGGGSSSSRSSSSSSSRTRPLGPPDPQQPSAVDSFAYLPPFEPTCDVAYDYRHRVGCYPINCTLDISCTVTNTSCCAYYNWQLLRDFDAFLTSKGLGDEYALVYGTALGALRNHTIMGHTHDVDIGLSVKAIQALEQNSTRLELWKAGYSFWYNGAWRLCPHAQHPLPEFRARMRPYTHTQWDWVGKERSAVYMDLYLMWPKNSSSALCNKLDFEGRNVPAAAKYIDRMHTLIGNHGPLDSPSSTKQSSTAARATAGKAAAASTTASTGSSTASTTASTGSSAASTTAASAATGDAAATGRVTDYCLWQSKLPIVLQEGHRPAVMEGVSFPAPINMEPHVAYTYGRDWRSLNSTYHGVEFYSPSWGLINRALLDNLSLTAWGNMTWETRMKRCAQLQQKQQQKAQSAAFWGTLQRWFVVHFGGGVLGSWARPEGVGVVEWVASWRGWEPGESVDPRFLPQPVVASS